MITFVTMQHLCPAEARPCSSSPTRRLFKPATAGSAKVMGPAQMEQLMYAFATFKTKHGEKMNRKKIGHRFLEVEIGNGEIRDMVRYGEIW